MKIATFIARYCLFLVLLSGCAGQAQPLSAAGPVASSTEEPVPASQPTPVVSVSTDLFIATDLTGATPTASEIVRWRFVKLNLGVLLDEAGQYRAVKEFTINLFPDKVYMGVIETFEQSGDGYTWGGYLKDVENSHLAMVYTGGVFIANFSSPEGVYEVSIADNDLYRIIQIDQSKFPGGEG
jgi:hypothetical protein